MRPRIVLTFADQVILATVVEKLFGIIELRAPVMTHDRFHETCCFLEIEPLVRGLNPFEQGVRERPSLHPVGSRFALHRVENSALIDRP